MKTSPSAADCALECKCDCPNCPNCGCHPKGSKAYFVITGLSSGGEKIALTYPTKITL